MKVRFFKPEEADPERDSGMKVPYGAAKRRQAVWRWYLVLLLVASPIIYFLLKIGYASAVTSAPGFVRQDQITIRTQTAGVIDSVEVDPPHKVEEGDPIVVLENEDLKVRQEELRSELSDLEYMQSNRNLENSSDKSIVAELKVQLQQAKNQRDHYESRVDEIRTLVRQGAATRDELTAAEKDHQQILTRISELKRAIADSGKTRTQTVIQPRIRMIKAELSSIKSRLDKLTVRAPKPGQITEISVIPGDQMSQGTSIGKLVPSNAEAHIAAYISPKDSEYAHIGQHGKVELPNGNKLLAQITEVPEVAARVPRGEMTIFNDAKLAILVRMQLVDSDEQPPSMAHGLPVRVRFLSNWESGIDFDFQKEISNAKKLGQEKWGWLKQTIKSWWS